MESQVWFRPVTTPFPHFLLSPSFAPKSATHGGKGLRPHPHDPSPPPTQARPAPQQAAPVGSPGQQQEDGSQVDSAVCATSAAGVRTAGSGAGSGKSSSISRFAARIMSKVAASVSGVEWFVALEKPTRGAWPYMSTPAHEGR
jgi:hypothetical protein